MASHVYLEVHLSENLGRPMTLYWEFVHRQTLALFSFA
jgi:hypothetical protein